MTAGTTNAFGWRVFGLGVMALGAAGLVFGDFISGQTVPKTFPDRMILAYVAAAFMLIAGAGVELRRTAAWSAAAITIYFGLIVAVAMNAGVVIRNYTEYGAYSGVAEQVAIAAGGLIVYAAHANLGSALAARLARIGQVVFGICAILFGGAHFFYMNLTAPLIPLWLPPSQEFWGYATGIFHIAGGIAIVTGIQARLAAILLTVMYASFIPLVFVPMLMADASDPFRWTEAATTGVLVGVAWVVADSLTRRRG